MSKIQKLRVDYSEKSTPLVWTDENTRVAMFSLGEYEVRYLSTKTINPDLIIDAENAYCLIGYENDTSISTSTVCLVIGNKVTTFYDFSKVIDSLVKECVTDIELFRTSESIYIGFSLEDTPHFVKLFDKSEYPKLFEELKVFKN